MRKQDELSDPHSCMSRALPGELTFVLLGRDITAPQTIRRWVQERIYHGKNTAHDAQIVEALACADQMEHEYAQIRTQLAQQED